MADDKFRALVVRETQAGGFEACIEQRCLSDLPPAELLIQVHYSSLNYKDAMSAHGNKTISKQYPHTPGIDAAGVVVQSLSPEVSVGDEVIVTGYDLGMNTPGGFGEYIRVPASWVIPLPAGMNLRTSMAYGTAGLTAGLCVLRLLEHGIEAGSGPIVVTGASGGVGSLALALLAKLGYHVSAISGKTDAKEYLLALGADHVVDRGEIDDDSNKPLLRQQWAGAVDTAGGNILATVIKSIHYGGAVSCCGLVASPVLQTTVYPFILRGVTLYGIDSAQCPRTRRLHVWQQLSQAWRLHSLEQIVHEIALADLLPEIEAMLAGRHRGRALIKLRP